MTIATEVAVREHATRLKSLETRLQIVEDENKMLRAALDNRGMASPVQGRNTLSLKGRAA